MDDDSSLETLESNNGYGGPTAPAPKAPFRSRRKLVWLAVGIGIAVLGALAVAVLSPKPTKKTPANIVINTQSLSAGTLQKIEKQNPGSIANEQLTISDSTIFKNDVAVQGETSLAKSVQLGGNLNVAGSTTVDGNLSVSGLLTVTSLGVGSVTAKNIKLTGDFSLGGHILPTGGRPTATASDGDAGGTISIEGTDTAGSVTIYSGTGALNAGQIALITFASQFTNPPHVQLTPVNAAAAALNYYVSQNVKTFNIQSATPLAAGTTYIFNYFVTQ